MLALTPDPLNDDVLVPLTPDGHLLVNYALNVVPIAKDGVPDSIVRVVVTEPASEWLFPNHADALRFVRRHYRRQQEATIDEH